MEENSLKTIPLDFTLLEESEMFERAKALNGLLQKRRTVRDYSNKPVPVSYTHLPLPTIYSV